MMQTILGQIPSKSNCYRIVTIRSHGSLAKTESLRKYEKSFYLQCNHYRGKMIKGLFQLKAHVYNSSQRPDLDNAFKILLDCLQQCKAIANDRNCVRIEAEKFVDKERPRVEFEILEV